VTLRHKTTARSRRAADRALALELFGRHAPIFNSKVRRCAVLRFFQVVETRRLELLTLSLQRRCSAS
jgi:hypothetical protein